MTAKADNNDNNDNMSKQSLTAKADEATKTRFRGHGANVSKEEQGDCLKVETVLKYFKMEIIHNFHQVDILGDTIENCSVYLFPFIIE